MIKRGLPIAALLAFMILGSWHQPARAGGGCLFEAGSAKSFACDQSIGFFPATTPSPITSPSYTTGWAANTGGGGGTAFQWMPTQVQGSAVASDGTVYQIGYYDEAGQELISIKNGVITGASSSNYLKQFGTGGTAAVATNGSIVAVGMQQTPTGGTNPCASPKPSPAPTSGHIWNSVYLFGTGLGTPNTTCDTTVGSLGGYGTQGKQIFLSDQVGTPQNISAPGGIGILPSGNIVVSDTQNNVVDIIDGTHYTLINQITVTRPGRIYVDQATGDFWVATSNFIQYLISRWLPNSGYQLLSYTSSGAVNSAGNITLPSASDIITGMCEDPSGDLVIGDWGSDQNFKVYSNPVTSPLLIGTIGYTGGMFASPAGQVGNMRFQGPVGCGFDAAGNFYATEQPYINGSRTEAYNGTTLGATKLWDLSTQTYIDNGAIDPNNPSRLYTMNAAYSYDPHAALGNEANWIASTFNPFAANAGDDPRTHDLTGGVQARNINGNTYLFVQNQLGTALEIYKRVGNLWQISDFINLGAFRASWPTSAPSGYSYSWLWRDTNNDGVLANGTYASPAPAPADASAVHYTTTNQMFYADKYGDIFKPWLADTSSGHDIGGFISEYPVQGVDANNNPIYSQATVVTKPLPSGNNIRLLYNIAYDADADTMYATGFPTYAAMDKVNGVNNDCVAGAGRNLEAYSHWSTTPVFVWSVPLPYNCSGGIYATYSPYRITQAGAYIFAGAINPNVIWVFKKSDGSMLMKSGSPFTMTTNNSAVSNTGNLDIHYPIDAYAQDPHHIDVTQEEDAKNKVIIDHVTVP